MTNALYQQAQNDIRNIHEQMTQLGAKRTILESRFRDIFLPYFVDGTNLYSIDINTWVNMVAGSPHSEVDVIDDVSGVVLYTVPPISDQGVLELKETNNTLTGAIDQANKIAMVSPGDAEIYIQQEFNKYVGTKNLGETFIKNVDRWNEILVRYGYPKMGYDLDKAEPSDETTVPSKPDALPILGYEEF